MSQPYEDAYEKSAYEKVYGGKTNEEIADQAAIILADITVNVRRFLDLIASKSDRQLVGAMKAIEGIAGHIEKLDGEPPKTLEDSANRLRMTGRILNVWYQAWKECDAIHQQVQQTEWGKDLARKGEL